MRQTHLPNVPPSGVSGIAAKYKNANNKMARVHDTMPSVPMRIPTRYSKAAISSRISARSRETATTRVAMSANTVGNDLTGVIQKHLPYCNPAQKLPVIYSEAVNNLIS